MTLTVTFARFALIFLHNDVPILSQHSSLLSLSGSRSVSLSISQAVSRAVSLAVTVNVLFNELFTSVALCELLATELTANCVLVLVHVLAYRDKNS